MDNNDTIFSEIKTSEVEVTLIQGFLVRLFDFAIDFVCLLCIFLMMPRALYQNIINSGSSPYIISGIVYLFISTAYRFIFLMLFNKTIGMMLCKAKLLNKELQPLSPKEKFISIFRTRFSTIKYYQGK